MAARTGIVIVALMLIGLFFFLLTKAPPSASPAPRQTSAEQLAMYRMVYVQDKYTGLCFGVISSNSSGGYPIYSATNVPCEAVKDQLEPQ
ncbi:hypothetical protein HY091_02320 [Candidatus Kaiserbacteria bacterium]|nr:hypothetical protein [Candidatus Kaiserbacteria bacterium]